MQIYLAKPGGQKSGPYTLEQVNADLASKKYRDDEYWAWHEGLPKWMPLHSVPGIITKPVPAVPAVPVSHSGKPSAPFRSAAEVTTRTVSAAAPVAVSKAPMTEASELESSEAENSYASEAASEAVAEPAAESIFESVPESAFQAQAEPEAEAEPETQSEPQTAFDSGAAAGRATSEIYSGLPFTALEQIFIFTTGEGRAVFESETVTQKLQEAIGEALDTIREAVPVDVVGRADVGVEVMLEGAIPSKAWRAMSAIRPAIAQKAKEELYEICVRPFSVETQDSIALFLLYNKEKFECATA